MSIPKPPDGIELATLTGKTVAIEALPGGQSGTRCIDLDDTPLVVSVLMDNGVAIEPPLARPGPTTPAGWLGVAAAPALDFRCRPQVILGSRYEATHESSWMESWIPPTLWELAEGALRGQPFVLCVAAGSSAGAEDPADVLESQPQRHLNLTLRVVQGVGDLAEVACIYVRNRGCKLRRIRNVEEIRPVLELEALEEGEVLEDGKVKSLITRAE